MTLYETFCLLLARIDYSSGASLDRTVCDLRDIEGLICCTIKEGKTAV